MADNNFLFHYKICITIQLIPLSFATSAPRPAPARNGKKFPRANLFGRDKNERGKHVVFRREFVTLSHGDRRFASYLMAASAELAQFINGTLL